MDFRLKDKAFAIIRSIHSKQEGIRILAERVPLGESSAPAWRQSTRSLFERVYSVRRRIGTISVGLIAVLLFLHVTFGANGMVVYQQKRAEYEALQKKISLEQKENDFYARQIEGLKTDEKVIEKEAREQLHYARPGDYVYVPSVPGATEPPANHSAKK